MARPAILVTCEHGGNRVPRRYAPLFRGHEDVLASHRGYDPGALDVARALAKRFKSRLFYSTTTRLLVELNRSLYHRALFSEFTRGLAPHEKAEVLERYYDPLRDEVERRVRRLVRNNRRVIHISSHTFTPVLDGEVRKADVGLLFDPQRPLEKRLCHAWQAALQARRPDLQVRRNYPYLGTADGFTTHLRFLFPPDQYLGIELEINQRWPLAGGRPWPKLYRDVVDALAAAIRNGLRAVP